MHAAAMGGAATARRIAAEQASAASTWRRRHRAAIMAAWLAQARRRPAGGGMRNAWQSGIAACWRPGRVSGATRSSRRLSDREALAPACTMCHLHPASPTGATATSPHRPGFRIAEAGRLPVALSQSATVHGFAHDTDQGLRDWQRCIELLG